MEPQEARVDERPRYEASPPEGDVGDEPVPTATTLSSMADILAAQGKDTECEFVLKRCIGQYPGYTPAYNSLAELQMRQGRVKEAAEVLSSALELRPADPVLLNNLGMCFLVHKEYERALDYFTRAAALVPENEKYRANMATSLGMLGRDDEALSLMEQILPPEKAKLNMEVLRTARARSAGSENNDP
jgi:Flp pilus assembly protein TadD